MTSRHSLYKSETKMKNATEVQLVNSIFQRKVNRLLVNTVLNQISLRVYKKMATRQAKFMEIFKEKYPEAREDVKKIFLEKYGPSPTKKELKREEVSKIENKGRGQFLIPRLCKKLNISMEDIE